jgi:uncharacterized repeat protein (TIGR01451 family)
LQRSALDKLDALQHMAKSFACQQKFCKQGNRFYRTPAETSAVHKGSLKFRTMFVKFLLVAVFGLGSLAASGAEPSTLFDAAASPLRITAVAERRVMVPTTNGELAIRYVPATEVSVGEEVHYTLRVLNTSNMPITQAMIVRALPHNTRYIPASATGPGADLSFSVDGGATFAAAQELKVNTYLGPRRATTDDYTHIRWQLRHPLAPGATALLRFRAEFL